MSLMIPLCAKSIPPFGLMFLVTPVRINWQTWALHTLNFLPQLSLVVSHLLHSCRGFSPACAPFCFILFVTNLVVLRGVIVFSCRSLLCAPVLCTLHMRSFSESVQLLALDVYRAFLAPRAWCGSGSAPTVSAPQMGCLRPTLSGRLIICRIDRCLYRLAAVCT